jgi:hypothetical protein
VFDGCGFDAHLGVYSSSLARLPTLRTRWGTPWKGIGSTRGFRRQARYLWWGILRKRGVLGKRAKDLAEEWLPSNALYNRGGPKAPRTCDLLAIATVSCIRLDHITSLEKKRGARACMHIMCLRRILLSRLFLATIVTRHLPFCYQRSPIFKYQDEKGFIKEHLSTRGSGATSATRSRHSPECLG